jgi:hypothetical protein
MGRPVVFRLKGPAIIECKNCRAHLTQPNELISRLFQGATGRAHLYNLTYNLIFGEEEERSMITGPHTVADAYCLGCNTIVGWKYIKAHFDDQRYKEGRVILEVFFTREVEQVTGRCIDNPDDKSLEIGNKMEFDCECLSLGIV